MNKGLENSENAQKKKKSILRYVIYFSIVLVATAVSLIVSLWGNLQETTQALLSSDWKILLLIVALVALSYMVDGLIILIFCRLYTRNYKFHQGLATSLVGQFYSDVTPSASGGQVMQVYTMKHQGIQVSNAASIMVMWFILYQSALIIFDLFAFIFQFDTVMRVPSIQILEGFSVPITPLIILGFLVNFSLIFLLAFMSYSHKFHNFILHYVIGFLGKIRILKDPDKARENLRVQVENFKIELRRLQANVPVLILQIVLFLIMLFLRNSIPYFAGWALQAWGDSDFQFNQMVEASFLSAFHQMVSGLIPLPGQAGVSETFYNYVFSNYFSGQSEIINATQIIWRTATFHLVVFVTGIVSAFYHGRNYEQINVANRQTFVNLQLETFDERKRSSDTMFETSQLSRREFQRKLAASTRRKKRSDMDLNELESDLGELGETQMKIVRMDEEEKPRKKKVKKEKPAAKPKKEPAPKPAKPAKKKAPAKTEDGEERWENWSI